MTDESQIQIAPKDASAAFSTSGNGLVARGRREAAILMAKGLECFLKLCEDAERGDADAQFNLGLAYCFGLELLEDYASGVEWYCIAKKEARSPPPPRKYLTSHVKMAAISNGMKKKPLSGSAWQQPTEVPMRGTLSA